MKYDIKYWHGLLALMLSVALVGCAGVDNNSHFSAQSAARSASQAEARLTGPFEIRARSSNVGAPGTPTWIEANLVAGKGNRATASGNQLVVLNDTPTGILINSFCAGNNVVGLVIKEEGRAFAFALSSNDGTVLNGKGKVGADGSVSGSYTTLGECHDAGTFTAGRVGLPLAGTYTGKRRGDFARTFRHCDPHPQRSSEWLLGGHRFGVGRWALCPDRLCGRKCLRCAGDDRWSV